MTGLSVIFPHTEKLETLKQKSGNYRALCIRPRKGRQENKFYCERTVKHRRKIDFSTPKTLNYN